MTPPPSVPPTPGAGWWRRNRWGLAALPVALALTVVAAGDRVATMWWDQDLRLATAAGPDGTVDFRQDLPETGGGTRPLEVAITLDGVRAAQPLPEDMVVPAGARAVQIDLTLSAEPDVILVGCRLAVRDAAGTRYEYVSNAWGAWQATSPCVPEDATGPWPSRGELDDEVPRPRTWSVSPVVVLPADVEVTDVVLWWQLPRYARLDVPR